MLEEIHLAGSGRQRLPKRRAPGPEAGFVGGGRGIARGLELTSSLGRWASQTAPPDAPRIKTSNFYKNPTMSDNMNKAFDQVAAFQKLWTDSFANMTSVWSQFSPGSPPLEEMREMRGGMLKVLAETWDEYMRTPLFMEMMKASLNGALDLKRMARDGMNRVHEQFENPTKEDIDGVLLAIRHVERRLLDRLEGLDDRVANLDQKIDKVDQRIAKQEDATEPQGQTSKTEA